MTEEQRYDQIELYLKGKFEGEELANFEKAVSNDPTLMQELEIQKLGRVTVQSSYMTDMKAKLKEASKAHKKAQSLKWYIGGACVVAASLLVVFWPKTEKGDKKDVVVNNDQPEDHIEKHFPIDKVVKVDSQETHTIHHFKADNASNHVVEEDSVPNKDTIDIEELMVTDTIGEDVYLFVKKTNFAPQELEQENIVDNKSNEQDNSEESRKEAPIVKPVLKFRVKESNYDIDNGRIDIVYRGDQVLKYKLKGGVEDFNSSTHFDEIGEGSYSIIIKDEAGNEFAYDNIEVNKSACFEKTEYVFNISYDGMLELPIGEEFDGVALIMDKSGNQVFMKEFDKFKLLAWDGTNTNGQEASVGLHKVIIKHTHGETCAYNVLIEK